MRQPTPVFYAFTLPCSILLGIASVAIIGLAGLIYPLILLLIGYLYGVWAQDNLWKGDTRSKI